MISLGDKFMVSKARKRVSKSRRAASKRTRRSAGMVECDRGISVLALGMFSYFRSGCIPRRMSGVAD